MEREEEKLCKTEFDKWLKSNHPSQGYTTKWFPGDDPPDYYLILDGNKYAVEVTRLIDTVKTEPNPLDSITISASTSKFVQGIGNIAKNKKILQGIYVINLRPLDNFRSLEKEIREKSLKYIEETRGDQTARPFPFFEDDDECFIQKLGSGNDLVAEAISYDGKGECDAEIELRQLIISILARKQHKLRNIQFEKILLILDSFLYVCSNNWGDYLPSDIERYGFSFIFRVAADKSDVAYSLLNLSHEK